MKKILVTIITLIAIIQISFGQENLEIVAELDKRPGNVAVGNKGRVFVTLHPLGSSKMQLIEITGKSSYKPYPNKKIQNVTNAPNDSKFDTPLGIVVDKDNWIWVIDMGLNLGKTRLFAFDIATGKQVFRYNLSKKIAPKGSFIQDLAVDKENGWVYLADIANPGIIAINIKNNTARRLTHKSVEAENVDMIIKGKKIHFGGKPARVAINPITLSADNETLFYGAMNGTTWYKLPTKLFREGRNDYSISKQIKVVGPKPVSDGATIDLNGNHYFTNPQNFGIDILTNNGELKPLLRNKKIDFPDNVRFGPNGWLYIAVNQLYKTPAFTGNKDLGKAPYYIFRTKVY
ncbi:L-dopachrome tautomerase-related protein [Tenacibaculum sp. nBUS_03]|uniref:L-dopachrome tautomerase-related protein n=1 Tax=Tenacibaculum sp. nBUS_03 TaxID=3395320 RepID=UPI003EBCE73A